MIVKRPAADGGGVSTPELAAAVSNVGGICAIGVGSIAWTARFAHRLTSGYRTTSAS